MKKTTIIEIVSLILSISLVYSLDECKGTMLTNEIPCLVLLPYTDDCTTVGIRFYRNGSTLLGDRLMAQYSPFACNQTFNYTSFGTYTFNYSSGDSGSIVIEEDENQELYLYLFAFFVYFVLVGIGYWKEEGTFLMIAGILAMIIGINIFNNGFPNLTNEFLKNSMVVIIWGVGAITLFFPIMEFFENWRDRE